MGKYIFLGFGRERVGCLRRADNSAIMIGVPFDKSELEKGVFEGLGDDVVKAPHGIEETVKREIKAKAEYELGIKRQQEHDEKLRKADEEAYHAARKAAADGVAAAQAKIDAKAKAEADKKADRAAKVAQTKADHAKAEAAQAKIDAKAKAEADKKANNGSK